MKSFTHLNEIPPTTRSGEHAGIGEIHFRRLWSAEDFATPIDFLDFTIIPPQSTIGWHPHKGNEEAYFIVAGAPLVRVEQNLRRLAKGDVSVVRSGQSHELINDTEENVEILVFQVRIVSEEGSK